MYKLYTVCTYVYIVYFVFSVRRDIEIHALCDFLFLFFALFKKFPQNCTI